MNRKLVLVMTLTIVIIGMLSITFRVQRAEAPSGAITINADGSVDPPTAPIDRDGNIYTFTDNINDAIVVERSHIIIDGNGFTLDGSGTGEQVGIKVESVAYNVTIQNMNIIDFANGIGLISCDQNKILGNNITNNTFNGIWLAESMNNTISGNSIKNNANGIFLNTTSYTTFSENTITNNYYGIWIETNAHDNKFYHNYFVDNSVKQVWSYNSTNVWDDGYPSGGNYWSNYTDVDLYSGPYQNETGSDEIWDHPYVIDVNNQDNYPLVPEFPTWTTMLLILIGLTFAIAIYNRRPNH